MSAQMSRLPAANPGTHGTQKFGRAGWERNHGSGLPRTRTLAHGAINVPAIHDTRSQKRSKNTNTDAMVQKQVVMGLHERDAEQAWPNFHPDVPTFPPPILPSGRAPEKVPIRMVGVDSHMAAPRGRLEDIGPHHRRRLLQPLQPSAVDAIIRKSAFVPAPPSTRPSCGRAPTNMYVVLFTYFKS
jgi:hypothetical protein